MSNTVRPWSRHFSVTEDNIDTTLVWILFPNLGMVYYDDSVLLTIALAMGTPLRVDMNTANLVRGRFTRVCIEIDLTVLVGKFYLNGKWYNVEYEGLHILCASCGCYGHLR